ncbi:kinase-like domain-containing protein [Gigaspora rosea]|uniref:Kinase-like domain-containing protein n=1 Tax=Gigaspora rosea TaxID=44941 RepID=A0A397UZW4_9GLOM|nr:kinase-like domain-containing protein [Gigaspora rosea]
MEILAEIRFDVAHLTYQKAVLLLDQKVYPTRDKQIEYMKKSISEDKDLIQSEKNFLFDMLDLEFDRKRFYKSGDKMIDKFIQKCQLSTIRPDAIVEWISYDQFTNIEYKTRGGSATIYIAEWKDGWFFKWENQKLLRYGRNPVILKWLDDSKTLSEDWIREIETHLKLTVDAVQLVDCFGLTKDPKTQNYILVLYPMGYNLRDYLQENNSSITFLQKILILHDVIISIVSFHKVGLVHGDLHSGNILQYKSTKDWAIGDLGLCEPVNKQSDSINGILPYIVPEVLMNKRIVNGKRPQIAEETPLWYSTLMESCWDENPENRPDANAIYKEIEKQLQILLKNKSL